MSVCTRAPDDGVRRQDRWETLRGEVDDAVQDIRRCVGVDFRERLRSII
jgi:hypothetical protein